MIFRWGSRTLFNEDGMVLSYETWSDADRSQFARPFSTVGLRADVQVIANVEVFPSFFVRCRRVGEVPGPHRGAR